jgi:hypothetical protein
MSWSLRSCHDATDHCGQILSAVGADSSSLADRGCSESRRHSARELASSWAPTELGDPTSSGGGRESRGGRFDRRGPRTAPGGVSDHALERAREFGLGAIAETFRECGNGCRSDHARPAWGSGTGRIPFRSQLEECRGHSNRAPQSHDTARGSVITWTIFQLESLPFCSQTWKEAPNSGSAHRRL